MAKTLAEAPKPAGLTAAATLAGGGCASGVVGEPLRGADLAGAWFFPFEGMLIDHGGEQQVERGPEGVALSMPADPNAPALSAPVGGVLALANGAAFEIAAAPGPLPAGASGLGPPRATGDGALSLPLALAFAFLGGLILNLMPCVFPVLSMKAAALAGHAHDPRAARGQGVAFMLGVLATFLALAGALIAARTAGQAVGWGFQLQSPAVTATLALVMLAVGLNLSGVYHMGLSVQGAGAGGARGGLTGAFLTGALAVVVAAPCTAPFMAGAIGFALTQPTAVALGVFAALGLGFAAPFTLASLSPALLRRLPRPGPWMGRLKQILALPMYAAAAWLAWVFARQSAQQGLVLLAVGAMLVALGAWLWGRGQARAGRVWPLRTAAATSGLFALLTVGAAAGVEPAARAPAAVRMGGEAFAPARLAALRTEGRPVFVNFTADWCVSCKVNEGVALSSRRVAEAFRRTGTVYMTGDWTARDPVIAAALAEHGRSGVPLYLVYPAGGGSPTVLPQLLTEGAVIKAVEDAAGA
jgi:thiol:disulfide interchange protein DsbD